MNKQKRNTHRYREHFDDFQVGEGLGGWVKMVEGLRSTNRWLQSSHGNVKYSLGNTVSNVAITVYGVRRVRDLSG